MPDVVIMRGLSGSGKSRLAEELAAELDATIISADDFHTNELGIYEYDPKNAAAAHAYCRSQARQELKGGSSIVIDNTNTTWRELEPYVKIAQKYKATYYTRIPDWSPNLWIPDTSSLTGRSWNLKHLIEYSRHGITFAILRKMAARWDWTIPQKRQAPSALSASINYDNDGFGLIETPNLDRIDSQKTESRRGLSQARALRHEAKQKRITSEKIGAFTELIDKIPEPGCSHHIITNGSFEFWTLLDGLIHLLNDAGHQVQEFWGSTWMLSRSNAVRLYEHGRAGKIKDGFIITGIYFKRKEPAAFGTLLRGIEALGWRYKAIDLHAKVQLLKAGPHRIVIESSANWTGNPRIEQFTITNSRKVFDFHRSWMADLLD